MIKPEHIPWNHEYILIDKLMDQLGGIDGSMIPDERYSSGLGRCQAEQIRMLVNPVLEEAISAAYILPSPLEDVITDPR